MRAFIDTSTLFKKYVDEEGTDLFYKILDEISEIIVAPTLILEVHSVLERRIREKSIHRKDAVWIEKEFLFDFNFFGVIEWNALLQSESTRLIRKHQLKVLDSIQLAGGCISKPHMFITSDKRLCKAAKTEVEKAVLI